jgi:hypothetical protein
MLHLPPGESTRYSVLSLLLTRPESHAADLYRDGLCGHVPPAYAQLRQARPLPRCRTDVDGRAGSIAMPLLLAFSARQKLVAVEF